MSSFIDTLEEPDKTELKKYQNIILRSDSKVVEKHTKIMSVENSLTYEEEGVFKYGLTKTKNHYSFHSMVMYSNADVLEYIKKYVKKGAKVQKGCVNFKNTSQLPIEIFQEIMLLSAKKDFSPVIEHYKKKI
jgi:hypothetical protein